MTTLKAFVSSTFTDLKAHRARALALLRGGGIHVDPMEDWSAAPDEPKEFSRNRLDGCDLAVLLVAFRRGFIPQGETRSITQMEYDEACRRKVPVLVFLLDDEAAWPRRFDEMPGDPGIREWREQLKKTHGVGFFGQQPESLDVMPAIRRWEAEHAEVVGVVGAVAQAEERGGAWLLLGASAAPAEPLSRHRPAQDPGRT
jgi:hypothetical protein